MKRYVRCNKQTTPDPVQLEALCHDMVYECGQDRVNGDLTFDEVVDYVFDNAKAIITQEDTSGKYAGWKDMWQQNEDEFDKALSKVAAEIVTEHYDEYGWGDN